MRQLIIVGGGMSGMVAAVTAARRGIDVTILEKNDMLGKKVLITGNGRANFTNRTIGCDCYESSDAHSKDRFVGTVLDSFGVEDMLAMISDLGMSYYEREGYYYPRTDEAATLRDTLLGEIDRLGVKVVYNYNLRSIVRSDKGYCLSDNNREYVSPNVLIAMGGKAAPTTGSSGDAYYYLSALGHSIVPTLPVLTTLRADYPPELNGVKALAHISLVIDDELVSEEFGFIKYHKRMLSGIPIYQHSLRAVPALGRGSKVEIVVDYLKDTVVESALALTGLDTYQALCRTINPKIVSAYYESDNPKLFSQLRYEIIGYGDYKSAQCTYGGVAISQIDPMTMMSKLLPGLYLSGEVIDIAGRCGGYNLHWAAATGYIAGSSV